MKKRAIFLLLLLSAAIAVLLLRKTAHDTVTDLPPTNAQTQMVESKGTASQTQAANKITQDDTVSVQERLKRLREDPKWDWKRPIRFYGKVVDEKGQPIPGATAQFSWSDADGEAKSTSATSDVNGLFSLLDQHGASIQVRLHHPSFYNSTNNPISFEYADISSGFFYRPNPDAPIVFTLKRKSQAEPLVVFKKSARIAKDGTPVFLDLIKGSVSSSPQGQLRLECLTMDKDRVEKRYDWTFTVIVPNGGTIESTNEFDFVAPSDNYSPTNVFIMRKEMASEWSSRMDKAYFLKLGDGRFGRMRLTMISGGDHFFKLESLVNPSGSRNLEFAPEAQPKQTQFE